MLDLMVGATRLEEWVDEQPLLSLGASRLNLLRVNARGSYCQHDRKSMPGTRCRLYKYKVLN